jgi:hypothetical protein
MALLVTRMDQRSPHPFKVAAIAIAVLPALLTHSVAQEAKFDQQENQWTSRVAVLTLADLPTMSFQAPPVGVAVGQWQKSQPAIVLDGSTLTIGQPGASLQVTLRLSALVLKNGARIVTNGSQLEIDALTFSSSGGQIVSFESHDPESAPAGPGLVGRSGNNGGRVLLDGEISGNDVLQIDLFGQNGQSGGAGRPGAAGPAGAAGNNAADHLFDCAHGGGRGYPGGTGQDGETGARGGRGGDGGMLTLKGRIAAQIGQINFSANEGTGGDGGPGGAGGLGGAGGSGGHGSTFCGGGPAGPAGASGRFGSHGPNGENGLRGRLIATVG